MSQEVTYGMNSCCKSQHVLVYHLSKMQSCLRTLFARVHPPLNLLCTHLGSWHFFNILIFLIFFTWTCFYESLTAAELSRHVGDTYNKIQTIFQHTRGNWELLWTSQIVLETPSQMLAFVSSDSVWQSGQYHPVGMNQTEWVSDSHRPQDTTSDDHEENLASLFPCHKVDSSFT